MKKVIFLILFCASVAYAALGDRTIIAPASALVPITTKVSGKALSGDITLNASDVGAVATTTKISGKPLSGDITLNAADVGAVAVTTFNSYTGSVKARSLTKVDNSKFSTYSANRQEEINSKASKSGGSTGKITCWKTTSTFGFYSSGTCH